MYWYIMVSIDYIQEAMEHISTLVPQQVNDATIDEALLVLVVGWPGVNFIMEGGRAFII